MPINAALIVCGLTTNAGNAEAAAATAFEHEGMTTVADFAHMTDKDVIEMCKAMNAHALTQPAGLSNWGIKGKKSEGTRVLGARLEKQATAY